VKNFRRWLFNVSAMVSLLVCVGAVCMMHVSGGQIYCKFITVDFGSASLFLENNAGKVVEIPSGTLFLLSSVLPLVWITIRYKRWRRLKSTCRSDICQNCGYDLRATPERCPECGTIPIKK
jgi:hypothetical protein